MLEGILTEEITTSGTSQTSAVINTKGVRLVCTEDAYFKIGKDPVADNSGTSEFLPANQVLSFPVLVPKVYKVAVIWASIEGTMNITTLRV